MNGSVKVRTPKAILDSVAVKHGITRESLCTNSRKAIIAAARRDAVKELRHRYLNPRGEKMSHSQIASLLNVCRSSVINILSDDGGHETRDHFDAAFYRKRLSRLAGVELHYDVAKETGLTVGQSVLLSILAERYPRMTSRDRVIELMCEAFSMLDMSTGRETSEETFKQYVSKTKKRFERIGLPEPIVFVHPAGYGLTDDVAGWMHQKFGSPVAYQAVGVAA